MAERSSNSEVYTISLIVEKRFTILYKRKRLAKAILNKAEVIEQTKTTGSGKGIFMKLLKIIGVIISFFAALLTCLHLLGGLEPIKAFISRILRYW